MSKKYSEKEVLDNVFNNPELYSLIIPNDITPYGIFWGGSRYFGLTTDTSDYDLNIIVSLEDYLKLEKDHKFRPSIYFNETRLHWYYIPVNIKFFNFEVYAFYGLEWWTITTVKQLKKINFIKIYDEEKIELFITILHKQLNTFKEMLTHKYLENIQTILKTNSLEDHLHKKSYIFLYLASLLNKSVEEDFKKICYIKQITAEIERPTKNSSLVLSTDLKAFILKQYNILYEWFIS